MLVGEGDREAQPVAAPCQFDGGFREASLVPGAVVTILSHQIDIRQIPTLAQPDAKGGDWLAFAVCRTLEPACSSGHASHDPLPNRRFVSEDVSDEMLLKHVAEGDKAAMHILFSRYRKRVLRFVQRIVGNPAIADDVVSQVFLDVWRSANRFENRARVSTWLLSIARFKAVVSLRARRPQTIESYDMLSVVDDADTPEKTLDRKETSGILQECITRLSPTHREVIDLFYYREKSIAEMSEITGVPHATVKSRIFYARKTLAKSLMEVGYNRAEGNKITRTRSRRRGNGDQSAQGFPHEPEASPSATGV